MTRRAISATPYKTAFAPTQTELDRLEEYASSTLLGVKPDTAAFPMKSLQDPDTHAVRMAGVENLTSTMSNFNEHQVSRYSGSLLHNR
jgi:hypothetical protein